MRFNRSFLGLAISLVILLLIGLGGYYILKQNRSKADVVSTSSSAPKYKIVKTSSDSEDKSQMFDMREIDKNGVIIKFKTLSVSEKRQEIKKTKGEEETDTIIDDSADTKSQLKKHRDDIKSEHKKFKDNLESKFKDKNKVKVINEYTDTFNGMAIKMDSNQVHKLKELTDVDSIYPNSEVKTSLAESVPQIHAPDVWNVKDRSGVLLTGKGMRIGIIDTGVDYTHADLGGCSKDQFVNRTCFRVVDGWDFGEYDSDPMDNYGHGTHVAATAAGNGLLKGVAPDAKIIAYKVTDSGGRMYNSTIITAIERSTDPNQDGDVSDHLDVINMSLGCDNETCDSKDPVAQASNMAAQSGVVVVAAAGNSGTSRKIGSPAAGESVIAVAAGNKTGTDPNPIAYFSSRGPTYDNILKPDITAPGVNICAAEWLSWLSYKQCKDSKHISISGTSMASPHVAGAIALLKQKNPGATTAYLKNIIMTTADDLGKSWVEQGSGQINIQKALNPKIYLLPTSQNINIVDTKIQTVKFTVKNLTSQPMGLKITPQQFSKVNYNETGYDENNKVTILSESLASTECLQPGLAVVKTYPLDINSIELGKYLGKVKIEQFTNCQYTQISQTNYFPVNLVKGFMVKLKINKPNPWYQANEKTVLEVAMLKKTVENNITNTWSSAWDNKKLFYPDIDKTFFVTFQDFDLMANILTMDYSSNPVKLRDDYIIAGKKLTFGQINTVVIDDSKTNLISQNSEALFSSKGLTIGEEHWDFVPLLTKSLFHEYYKYSTELGIFIDKPHIGTGFTNLSDPFHYQISYAPIAIKPNQIISQSDTLMYLAYHTDYPFDNLNLSIPESKIVQFNYLFKQIFSKGDQLYFWNIFPQYDYTNYISEFNLLYNNPNPKNFSKKIYIQNDPNLFREGFWVISKENSEIFSEMTIVGEHSRYIDQIIKPGVQRKLLDGPKLNLLLKDNGFIQGNTSDLVRSSFGFEINNREGYIRVTQPDGTKRESQSSQWGSDCGETTNNFKLFSCQKGDYIVDWEIPYLFYQSVPYLEAKINWDGTKFTIVSQTSGDAFKVALSSASPNPALSTGTKVEVNGTGLVGYKFTVLLKTLDNSALYTLPATKISNTKVQFNQSALARRCQGTTCTNNVALPKGSYNLQVIVDSRTSTKIPLTIN